MKRIILVLFACLLVLSAVQASQKKENWIGTWATAPLRITPDNMPPTPGLAHNSLRQVVKVSIGGDKIRVKLSNEYSQSQLEIKSVYVAVSQGGCNIDARTAKYVSFKGKRQVSVSKGGMTVSDPVPFKMSPLQQIAITINYGETPQVLTGHPGSRTTSYIINGESKPQTEFAKAATPDHWYTISGLDVEEADGACVAILGNSITDGYAVPTYGSIDCGSTNWGSAKTVSSSLCMIPVDVILGDLYLEANRYENAAKYYYAYLYQNKKPAYNYIISISKTHHSELPSDFPISFAGYGLWDLIFISSTDVITYIPMAVNKLKGKTTNLPAMFGFDYYSTKETYTKEPQIEPSTTYNTLCSTQNYFYIPKGSSDNSLIKSANIGDLRKYAMVTSETEDDSTYIYVKKYNNGNILLYRTTTIYLHLAEALNRMGYPDAAFAILKDGLKEDLASDTTYITSSTKKLLTTTLPFLSNSNSSIFDDSYGIHGYGGGKTGGTFSPYQMDTIVGNKLAEITAKFGVTLTKTKADTINAVEDLICDEYALEFAFEGNRFGDLCRIARHKNAAATYSSNFGGEWLAKKLAFKNLSVNLEDESKWYLPFK